MSVNKRTIEQSTRDYSMYMARGYAHGVLESFHPAAQIKWVNEYGDQGLRQPITNHPNWG